MERRITEEQVTKGIIRWLSQNGWQIIAFDFPQSGTGRCLHPNDSESKTDGIWIPDIIAYHNSDLLIFENKDRYVESDFIKVKKLKHTSCYSNAIKEITKNYPVANIYYGIGFPKTERNLQRAESHLLDIDFLVSVIQKDIINIEHDPFNVFNE